MCRCKLLSILSVEHTKCPMASNGQAYFYLPSFVIAEAKNLFSFIVRFQMHKHLQNTSKQYTKLFKQSDWESENLVILDNTSNKILSMNGLKFDIQQSLASFGIMWHQLFKLLRTVCGVDGQRIMYLVNIQYPIT